MQTFLQGNLVTCVRKTKLQSYKTLVRPIAEYAYLVWDPVGNKQLQYQLEQAQIKAARWTESNWDYKSSANNIVQNLGLPSLEIARLKMLHSIDCNQKSLLDQSYQSVQGVKISGSNHYSVECKHTAILLSFSQQWNTLPANTVNVACLVKFSEKYQINVIILLVVFQLLNKPCNL